MEKLQLQIHPKKIELRTIASGVDFLGWIQYPAHRVLRTVTKYRMFRRITEKPTEQVVSSYSGLLHHGSAEGIADELKNRYWMFSEKE